MPRIVQLLSYVTLLLLSACTEVNSLGSLTTTGSTGVPPGETTSSTTGTPTTGTDPAAWPPAACAGLGSPFLDAECLGELRDACRSLASEAACTDQEPLVFGDSAFIIHCGWAKVVQFSDMDACTIATTTRRCEAGLDYSLLGCGDHCSSEPTLHYSLHAEVEAMELIEMPCGPTGNYLGGPLGPASAVGAEEDEFGSTCAPNIKPPAHPLCMCTAAACSAE